jgi:carnitine O-octanoyltransferase
MFQNFVSSHFHFNKNHKHFSGGSGNFYLSTSLLGYIPHGGIVAPMCLDGYGCFYNILDDRIMVAVSSWRCSSETSAAKLSSSFAAALEQMQTAVLHPPAKI